MDIIKIKEIIKGFNSYTNLKKYLRENNYNIYYKDRYFGAFIESNIFKQEIGLFITGYTLRLYIILEENVDLRMEYDVNNENIYKGIYKNGRIYYDSLDTLKNKYNNKLFNIIIDIGNQQTLLEIFNNIIKSI